LRGEDALPHTFARTNGRDIADVRLQSSRLWLGMPGLNEGHVLTRSLP
jgi:hypothetical protein